MKKEKRSTVTNLSREDFIRKKSIKAFFFSVLGILSVGLVCILLTYYFEGNSKKDYLSLTIIVLVFAVVVSFILKKFIFYMEFNAEFNRLSSVKLVYMYLSSNAYTEVIPIPTTTHEHSYFFIDISNIANFYAIISDESTVAVYLKFNTEEKYRFIERIHIEDFSSYYKIK